MSSDTNSGGTDAADACGTQKGELVSGRVLAAKCPTWAQALILYNPYHWTYRKYHYLRIFHGDSAGCSEQFRVKNVERESRPNPCHTFVYRAGSLPCWVPGQTFPHNLLFPNMCSVKVQSSLAQECPPGTKKFALMKLSSELLHGILPKTVVISKSAFSA